MPCLLLQTNRATQALHLHIVDGRHFGRRSLGKLDQPLQARQLLKACLFVLARLRLCLCNAAEAPWTFLHAAVPFRGGDPEFSECIMTLRLRTCKYQSCPRSGSRISKQWVRSDCIPAAKQFFPSASLSCAHPGSSAASTSMDATPLPSLSCGPACITIRVPGHTADEPLLFCT